MAAKKPAKAKKPAPKKAPPSKAKPATKAPPKAKAAVAPKAKTAPPKAKAAPVAAKPAPKPVAKAAPVKSSAPVAKPVVAPKAVAPVKASAAPAAPAAPAKAPAPPVRKAGPAAPPRPVVTTSVRPKPQNLPAGDEDTGDSLSLLAGPRNVKPYLAKKGEQYMGKAQLEHFRKILSTWKRDLMEEVDRTVTHMKDEAANPPDPNDRATLESEFSLELRTRDRERKLIRKIDEAIGRIEDGSYGYCLETGEEIGIKRLEARPVATLSIEAQERRERREKQYGDRDDRYR
jgi:DnaK suppressor protein